MAQFSSNAHWRDSARNVRFFVIDYRAAFPLLMFLLHIQWWSFILAVIATIFFGLLERYGFSVIVFIRWFGNMLAGKRKIALPWWRE